MIVIYHSGVVGQQEENEIDATMFGAGHQMMDPSISFNKDEFEYSDKFSDDLFEYR